MEKQCGKVRELLSLYIDDVLCDDEKEYVRDHLASCEGCRGEYEFLCGIINQAEQMPVLTVSDAMHSKIMQGIKCEQNKPIPPKRFRQNVWRMASGFAAAAAVIAISVISYSSLPKHPDLTTEPTTEIHQTLPSEAPTNEPLVEENEKQPEEAPAIAKRVAEGTPESRKHEKINASAKQAQVAKPEKSEAPKVSPSDSNAPVEVAPDASSEALSPDVSPSAETSIAIAPAAETAPLTADEPVAGEENNVPSSSGGRIVTPVTCYYIGDASYEEAVLILDAYEFDGIAYVIPVAEKNEVYEKLQALPDFVRYTEEAGDGENIRIALASE